MEGGKEAGREMRWSTNRRMHGQSVHREKSGCDTRPVVMSQPIVGQDPAGQVVLSVTASTRNERHFEAP